MLFETGAVEVDVYVEPEPALVLSLVVSVDDLLPPLQAIIKKEAANIAAIKIFFI